MRITEGSGNQTMPRRDRGKTPKPLLSCLSQPSLDTIRGRRALKILAVPVKLMANSEEFTTDHVCSLSMWPVNGMPRYTGPTPGGGSPG